ncbi:hypothetical protein SCLCIDRAFT_31520 [Scleroderma citrinum Foug A]|uniref:Uncharacterized protein n=1 Tax=Scleroderma citrinum Foug A TaxID=1036808 RepID=A0A0C3CZB3_9AGAM|nr:hypothetical protein SCLCIDRAFT_31520 [Scleroderma citrinum Foug A]
MNLRLIDVKELIHGLRRHIDAPPTSYIWRCDFDAATSMDESNDSVSTIWSVSGWLHGVAMSQPSRYGLDSIMSTVGSNDLQATFWVIWEWLRDALAF